MLIVYIDNGSGWEPITHMVNLAAELFEAELVVLNVKTPRTLWSKLEMFFLRRQKLVGTEACLLVYPDAVSFLRLPQIEGWQIRFSSLAVWVIDSFWVDRIPKAAKLSRPFDHVFITSEEDIPAWTNAMRTPTSCLAWGSDVLRIGVATADRTWDLARIGRQPPEWDDDEHTKKRCANKKISFHGRIKGEDTAAKNQAVLKNLYKQTKFLLAFSNAAHFNHYTHPTRQYITARWTDALACGAIVAGIAPNEPSINRLLWDGATLDLKSIKIDEGLEIIAEAVKIWKPEQAKKNQQLALERLDWRWRFAEIAIVLGESPKRLDEEVKLLKQKIAD